MHASQSTCRMQVPGVREGGRCISGRSYLSLLYGRVIVNRNQVFDAAK